jgi:hypothetical protein
VAVSATGRLWVLSLVAAAALAAATTAPAATTGQICSKLTKYHHTYRWSTAGSFTCSQAKPYLLRILATPVRRGATGNVKLTTGPKGYHCQANLWDAKRRITSGVCFKHTLAFPGAGFQWFAA